MEEVLTEIFGDYKSVPIMKDESTKKCYCLQIKIMKLYL